MIFKIYILTLLAFFSTSSLAEDFGNLRDKSKPDKLMDDWYFQFENSEKVNKIRVPSSWHNTTNDPLFGTGTYTREIDLSDKPEPQYLLFEKFCTEAKIFIDGELVAQTGFQEGKPAPAPYPTIVKLPFGPDHKVKLKVVVRNLEDNVSGIIHGVFLGNRSQINNRNYSLQLWCMAWLSIYFIFGFYHTFMFLFQRKDKASLFLWPLLFSLWKLLSISVQLFLHRLWDSHHSRSTTGSLMPLGC